MTDNHWRYTRNHMFADLLARHGIRHITIKPYHRQQNGEVERYNQTLKREWANLRAWSDNEPETKPSNTDSTTTITTDPTTASEANHQSPDCNQPTGYVHLGREA